MRAVPRGVFPQDRCAARISRGLRRGAHEGRLARRPDPAGIRRLGAGRLRGLRDHGGDQPRRRQRGRMPWPDVQHGHAAQTRRGGAEGEVPARDRARRAAAAVDGRDRALGRKRYHRHRHICAAKGRALRGQRAEGLDLARAPLGPDDPARANDAPRRDARQVRGALDLPGRPARGDRQGAHGAAHRQHGEPRRERALLRKPRDPGGEPDRRGRPRLSLHPRRPQRRTRDHRRRVHRRRSLVHRPGHEVRRRAHRVRPPDRCQPGRSVSHRAGLHRDRGGEPDAVQGVPALRRRRAVRGRGEHGEVPRGQGLMAGGRGYVAEHVLGLPRSY